MNNHLQEIRAQKVAALREARRLKDQLFQSQASLERAERRQQLLEADGATEVGDGAAAGYEDSSKPQAETTEPEEKQAE